ncbi:MAG: hypothetical protein IJ366_09210 [Clostridia bacterium]|nr:hypothetical protein [Clostridia bacterium]
MIIDIFITVFIIATLLCIFLKIKQGSVPFLDKIQKAIFSTINMPVISNTQNIPEKKIVYEPLPETFPIDIHNFIKTGISGLYDIPPMFRYLAFDSVDTINVLLMQAYSLVGNFPKTQLTPEQLCFHQSHPDIREYTYLLYHPYTPTGKIAKYPYSIHFHNNQSFYSGTCLFGTIYHLVDGRIGKIRIMRWYNGILYTVNCAIKRNALQVIKIEKSDNGEQKTLYNFNAK